MDVESADLFPMESMPGIFLTACMERDPLLLPPRISFHGILTSGIGDWLLLCLVVSVFLGFAFGVFTLVLALCGGTATANIIVLELRGIPAGLANLIWAPVLFGTASIPLGMIGYLPLRLLRSLAP